MGEVIRIERLDHQKHLDKILERMDRAYRLKGDCIIGEVTTVSVEDVTKIIRRITDEYEFYKKEYGL